MICGCTDSGEPEADPDPKDLILEIGSVHTVGLERTEDDFLFWEKEITVSEE